MKFRSGNSFMTQHQLLLPLDSRIGAGSTRAEKQHLLLQHLLEGGGAVVCSRCSRREELSMLLLPPPASKESNCVCCRICCCRCCSCSCWYVRGATAFTVAAAAAPVDKKGMSQGSCSRNHCYSCSSWTRSRCYSCTRSRGWAGGEAAFAAVAAAAPVSK